MMSYCSINSSACKRHTAVRKQSRRTAFTLVELLVVIAIIGILMAITLPAINSVRRTARANTCKSNIRQIGQGVIAYSLAKDGKLPAQWRTANPRPWENFSWAVAVLDQLDGQNVKEAIDLESLPFSARNREFTSISQTIFECPATPSSPRSITQLRMGSELLAGIAAGARDYVPVHDVLLPSGVAGRGVWRGGDSGTDYPDGAFLDASEADGSPFNPEEGANLSFRNSFDPTARTIRGSLANIPDGSSNTVLLVERAGRPDDYSVNGFHGVAAQACGTWATGDMAVFGGANVQDNNATAPFSFHDSATVAMCDGSVHTWSASMDRGVMRALLTADGKEIVDDSDWK